MAPLKFEEKIKEKLEHRSIRPSENSWEKLSAQLDNAQNQKKGFKTVWWYSVAAVFIGVIVVTSVVKNNNSASDQMNTQFVDTNSKESIEKQNDDRTLDKNIEQKSIKEKEILTIDNSIDSDQLVTSFPKEKEVISPKNNVSSNTLNPKSLESDAVLKAKDYDSSIARNDENRVDDKKQEDVLLLNANTIEDKVANVVAKIQDMQNNNVEVTEDEINALLLQAQREITTKKIMKQNTVSASALLQDIEEELDETFKERVYEALKTGFQKVKTTVAERKN
ncbi:hypothetical protein [Aquimarina sp. 2304DJ70-9]|uniref:hypothetical protein n=1 Tax=Aquimarina penaris TaxID=3231044 RepID=UPI003462E042